MKKLEDVAYSYADKMVELPQGLPDFECISDSERSAIMDNVARDFITGADYAANWFIKRINDPDEKILKEWLDFSEQQYHKIDNVITK